MFPSRLLARRAGRGVACRLCCAVLCCDWSGCSTCLHCSSWLPSVDSSAAAAAAAAAALHLPDSSSLAQLWRVWAQWARQSSSYKTPHCHTATGGLQAPPGGQQVPTGSVIVSSRCSKATIIDAALDTSLHRQALGLQIRACCCQRWCGR